MQGGDPTGNVDGTSGAEGDTAVGQAQASAPSGGNAAAAVAPALFAVAEVHDVGDHHLRVIDPVADDWLEQVAREYRRLRTATRAPKQALSFDGIEMLDVTEVEALIASACVPTYKPGNFGVARSDLAEVIMGMLLESDEYRCRYGYRSVRDRELRQSPGRGIDQIGVEVGVSNGEPVVNLVLGEAKASKDGSCPPAVVDTSNDGLREQHLGHLEDRQATADKVVEAGRSAENPDVQALMLLAATMLRDGHPSLNIVAASLMVRPAGIASAPGDFGSFYASPGDYSPASLRFLLVRLPAGLDLDSVAEEFARLAQEAPDAAA